MHSLWTQMWFLPRPTIRQIVESNPNQKLPLLIAGAGIAHALSFAAGTGMGKNTPLPALILFAIIMGPVSALLTVWVGGYLLRWSAAKLGGSATVAETRAAIAWSWVPIVTILPLWIPRYILFADELFKLETPRIDSIPTLSFLFDFINSIEFIVVIWGALLLYSALAEINRFSAWRGFVSVLFAISIVYIPLLLILLLIGAAGM